MCHWQQATDSLQPYRIHCAAAEAYTVALKMAESNDEYPNRRGYCALNKWLEENKIRRVGGEGISKDEIIEEMGKVVKRSTGTQWEERPVCVVGPKFNNHIMRTGETRGVHSFISFLKCNCSCQTLQIELWYC